MRVRRERRAHVAALFTWSGGRTAANPIDGSFAFSCPASRVRVTAAFHKPRELATTGLVGLLAKRGRSLRVEVVDKLFAEGMTLRTDG